MSKDLSHIHIPSGDDDLFIKEVVNKNNVAIQIHKDADIFTHPKNHFFRLVLPKKETYLYV